MGNDSILYVDEASLALLKNAFKTAGDTYIENLNRLNNLIDDIVGGSISGDPATDFYNKYSAKADSLKQLRSTIEEGQEYMGIKSNKFTGLVDELSTDMR